MGDTILMNRMRATRRAVPLFTGALLIALGVIGVEAVGLIPRLVIGALLVMVGLTLLENWLRGLRRTVSNAERALSVAILLVICLLYTSPSPRDRTRSRMPSSA